MGLETQEIRGVLDTVTLDDEPRPGGRRKRGGLGYPEETQIRYFVACIADDANRAELEGIMTKSLSCAGELKNHGDIFVISETGTFDRDGCYQVAVKYLYLP